MSRTLEDVPKSDPNRPGEPSGGTPMERWEDLIGGNGWPFGVKNGQAAKHYTEQRGGFKGAPPEPPEP